MENQELIDYIQSSLNEGRSREEIYKELLAQGWTIGQIENAFNQTSYQKVEKEKREIIRKEDTQKRTIQIIVVIGAILIGAGIFSFIAANWQEMSKPLKISIIVISMLASYTAGWYLREKFNFLKTGGALILLGSIIYGAGIFLVAQMFNIRANWPDGFILWMIGVIIMAYAMDLYWLYYFAIPLGFVAFVGNVSIIGLLRIFGGGIGYVFLLTSSFLLLAATIITFLAGWSMHRKIPKEIKDFYY